MENWIYDIFFPSTSSYQLLFHIKLLLQRNSFRSANSYAQMCWSQDQQHKYNVRKSVLKFGVYTKIHHIGRKTLNRVFVHSHLWARCEHAVLFTVPNELEFLFIKWQTPTIKYIAQIKTTEQYTLEPKNEQKIAQEWTS